MDLLRDARVAVVSVVTCDHAHTEIVVEAARAGVRGILCEKPLAIDLASASTWATLQVTRRNPSAQWTSALARTVAADLAARGWKLERVMSDNAQEFRAATFQTTSPPWTPATASSDISPEKT